MTQKPPPLFDLSSKIAVVSGAASGMGKASSLALAAHGATVVLLDRNEAGLAATAREIAAAGGRGHIAYSMAMGAVAQMTRELSTEWAARGVRVNAILPAQVLNPGLEQRIAADPAIEAKWLAGIPRGRLGRPEDIQGLIVLLASDASSWITGTLIPMDGGNLAMNAGGSIGPSMAGDDA